MREVLPRRGLLAALSALLLATACSSPGGTASPVSGPGESAAPTEVARNFEAGPAVLVPVGYEPPTDRVDSTGAYIPVNDQPTLVFLEAIW